MIRIAIHLVVALALTMLTQLGGIAYAVAILSVNHVSNRATAALCALSLLIANEPEACALARTAESAQAFDARTHRRQVVARVIRSHLCRVVLIIFAPPSPQMLP